jgi:hypothetical protein
VFNCLREVNRDEMKVVEGMNISIKRRRFTLVEDNRPSKRDTIYLNGKIVSTKHPKFYIVEIKSNYKNRTYLETILKDDFQSKIHDQTITIH